MVSHVDSHSRNDLSIRLLIVLVVLQLIGLSSSIYLTDLFVDVHKLGGQAVDSFCAVSERINCVTVADSEYSTVLGIPVSMWGIEYYLMTLALLAWAIFGAHREIAASLSYLLFFMSLFVSAILGYISVTQINSICLMCLLVYTVNTTSFVIMTVLRRGAWKEFLVTGPAGALSLIGEDRRVKTVAITAAVIGLVQFAVLPPLFAVEKLDITWGGIPYDGLSIGRPDAPVHIEEFTDFQCPFCSRANQEVKKLVMKYPTKIRVTHHDYPLSSDCNPYLKNNMHPQACDAAAYARCAAEQGQFPEMAEFLFANRTKITEDNAVAFAKSHKMDAEKFLACVKNPQTARAIRKDIETGTDRKMTGTPCFFVNGEMVKGYKPLEFWEKLLADKLGIKSGEK